MAFWNKKEDTPQTFSDLIRGLQYAVNTAQQMLSAHQQMLFNRYFEEDGTPYCRTVNVADKKLTVPYISLVNHQALGIDEIELEFKAQVDSTMLKDNTHRSADNPGSQVDRSSFEMSFAPCSSECKTNVMDVKVRFKQLEPPEGFLRVTDAYDKVIKTSETAENTDKQQ